MKKTIGIIFGGKSSEYEVSLKSVSYIIECLKDKYILFLIGITKTGEWYEYQGDVNKIITDEWINQKKYPISIDFNNKTSPIKVQYENITINYHLDCIFPVLHGRNGEDGSVQGLFQLLDIPIFGCEVLSSAVCMDKDIAQRLARQASIKVTKSLCLHKNDGSLDYIDFFNTDDYPLYVKPANEGSSCGMSKVINKSELAKAIEYAYLFDTKIIIEKEVKGFEVGCAIIGTNVLNIGSIDEVELHMSDGFFDYNEKYTQNYTTIHPDARVSEKMKEEIKNTALDLYKILNCSGFARIDLFVDGNDIYFNEVNTIPGLTKVSRFPKMIEQSGLSFKDVLRQSIDEIIE